MKHLFALSLFLYSMNFAFGQTALGLDGIDDVINCGNGASVQLTGNTITLEAWIYPHSWQTSVWQGNIINKENNNPDYGYMLRVGNGGNLNFNLGNGTWNELTTTTAALTLNTWQHVAASYDGTTMKIFHDGVMIASQSSTVSILNAPQVLAIGNWSNYLTANRPFDGLIDNVRIWNIARSDADIANFKDSCLTGNESGLAALYQFDEGSGTTTQDITGNGNMGTLTNMSPNPWVPGIMCTPPCATFGAFADTACFRYVSPSGNQVWTSSGMHTDTLLNSQGCDSIITANILIKNVIVSTHLTGSTINAIQGGAIYQWINCADSSAVPGATNQSFTPAANGSYAVIVDNGCVDTSACVTVNNVSVHELDHNTHIGPNPTKAHLNFESLDKIEHVAVYSIQGKLLLEEWPNKSDFSLDLQELLEGTYLVKYGSSSLGYVSRRIIVLK